MPAPLFSATVTTRLLPPFTVDIPSNAPASGPGIGAALLAAVQPQVELSVAGQPVQTWAPAGKPTTNLFPAVVAILAVVLGLAAFGLYTLVKKG
jgi:hypothetical protein